jgi:hypothetical protein
MEIEDVEEHFVPFKYIREALEKAGIVGNLTLKFNTDPNAPRGYQFRKGSWRLFKRADADAYIARQRVNHGLSPSAEDAK